MSRLTSFKSAVCAALLLAFYGTQAQADCSIADQIVPNPIPLGNTINDSSSTACNGLIFPAINSNRNQFEIYGTLNNNSGGIITNFGDKIGSASSRGFISIREGTLNNNVGATFNNYHFVGVGRNLGGELNNFGTFNNYSVINVTPSSTLINHIGGTFNLDRRSLCTRTRHILFSS